MQNMIWYDNLNKPFLTPPDSIFTVAWVILYILIAVSLIVFISGGINSNKIKGLVCFFIQIILNFAWSNVFFGMKNIGSALAVLVLMWIFIFLTIIFFYKQSKLAAYLLIPYFLWVTFAFYLNFGFFLLN